MMLYPVVTLKTRNGVDYVLVKVEKDVKHYNDGNIPGGADRN